MKVSKSNDGHILTISDLQSIDASNCKDVREQVLAFIDENTLRVEFDLTETVVIDSCGLGALITIYRIIAKQNGVLALLHPITTVQQVLEMTRMHQIFEIVK